MTKANPFDDSRNERTILFSDSRLSIDGWGSVLIDAPIRCQKCGTTSRVDHGTLTGMPLHWCISCDQFSSTGRRDLSRWPMIKDHPGAQPRVLSEGVLFQLIYDYLLD